MGSFRQQDHVTRIVIAGAGFAGMHALRGLHENLHGRHDIEILIVNAHDYFLLTALVHEAATGGLALDDVSEDIREAFPCCVKEFIRGRVVEADLDRKIITIETDGALSFEISPRREVWYDYLVLSLGFDVNYFNVPGAREHALPLRSRGDARAVKNRIIDSFSEAAHSGSVDDVKRLLHFIIVGGGATAIELAGELTEFISRDLADTFPSVVRYARLSILQGDERLLPRATAWFDRRARKILARRMRVDIHTKSRVSEVRADGVSIEGRFYSGGVVMWAAGVTAREIPLRAARGVVLEDATRRMKVNMFLQIPDYEEVYVAGDQAWIWDRDHEQPYPMRAQFAVREGACAARNIARAIRGRQLTAFAWRDKGIILSLGHGQALASAFGLRFSGLPAWLLHRAAYIMNVIGIRERLRLGAAWIFCLFSSRDVGRL